MSTHIANWPVMKSLTDELDGKLCIDVHGYVCMYVCMLVHTHCMFTRKQYEWVTLLKYNMLM